MIGFKEFADSYRRFISISFIGIHHPPPEKIKIIRFNTAKTKFNQGRVTPAFLCLVALYCLFRELNLFA